MLHKVDFLEKTLMELIPSFKWIDQPTYTVYKILWSYMRTSKMEEFADEGYFDNYDDDYSIRLTLK